MLQAAENEKWTFMLLISFMGIVIVMYFIDKIKNGKKK
jgi:hypothetical protein